MSAVRSPGGLAWDSLTTDQRLFIQRLPKVELHAHLNGCIPLPCLQDLAHEFRAESYSAGQVPVQADEVQLGLEKLERGVTLDKIDDFFSLFPAIYALTSKPAAAEQATRAVLNLFLRSDPPQCDYIELRTTPRETAHMSARRYLTAVLDVLEEYEDKAALIVSIDRRMTLDAAKSYVQLAAELKADGRRVVGIDLCGDPMKGDMELFVPILSSARTAGLRLTVHIAETAGNTEDDTTALLSLLPDRLGHATFLSPAAQSVVLRNRTPIEICLTSNILCKTVDSLQDHHVTFWLTNNHPVAICTDDTLPFRNSLWEEYALLLATPPLGLGRTEDDLQRISRHAKQSVFD